MGIPSVANILKSGAIVWIAPKGEAFPDASTIAAGVDWGGNWERVGYTKEPVAMKYEADYHETVVEEFLAAVGRKKIGEKASIETVLAELTSDYLQYGTDGTVTATAAGVGQVGEEELAVGNDSEITEYTIGFEGIRYDASNNALAFRVGLHICTLKLNGDLTFSKKDDDYTGVPLLAEALANTANSGRLIYINRVTAPATS